MMQEINKYARIKLAHESAKRKAQELENQIDEQLMVCKKAYPDISYDRFIGLVALEERKIAQE